MSYKVTKAEKKALHTNAAVECSIRDGELITTRSGAQYRGKPPVFAFIANPFTGLESLRKVKPGIPYVRVG